MERGEIQMHVIFFARGIYSQVKLWETLMQGTFWRWERKNLKTNKKETILVQGALRPSVLGAYEYIIPKECLAECLAVMGITKNEQYGFGKFGLHSRHWALRKVFGAKKVPKKVFDEANKINPSLYFDESMRGLSSLKVHGVAIHLIGIKEDDYRECQGYMQEML